MTLINQRNYPNDKLGYGVGSIADYGCTLSCLAMFAEMDVLELNKILKGPSYEKSAFSGASKNLIAWTKLEELTGGTIKFHWRGYGYDEAAIKTAIEKHGACLVEVDFDGTPRTDDKHWILATGNKQANDPWGGQQISTSKYPLWTGWAEIEIVKGETMPTDLETCMADRKKFWDERDTLWRALEVDSQQAALDEIKKLKEHECPTLPPKEDVNFGEETGTKAIYGADGALKGYEKTYKPIK